MKFEIEVDDDYFSIDLNTHGYVMTPNPPAAYVAKVKLHSPLARRLSSYFLPTTCAIEKKNGQIELFYLLPSEERPLCSRLIILGKRRFVECQIWKYITPAEAGHPTVLEHKPLRRKKLDFPADPLVLEHWRTLDNIFWMEYCAYLSLAYPNFSERPREVFDAIAYCILIAQGEPPLRKIVTALCSLASDEVEQEYLAQAADQAVSEWKAERLSDAVAELIDFDSPAWLEAIQHFNPELLI
jgi:hypothetical protein